MVWTSVVMSNTVKETMVSWVYRRRKRRCTTQDVAPLALIWTIWKERNRRVFDGVEKDYTIKAVLLSFIAFGALVRFLYV